ncbi:MAG: sulfatase-like hydrolase/transferase, partial [Verrucomicrobiota bacterium]
AEKLAARGYATALFGKWHLARGYTGAQSIAEGPDKQGFAENYITHKPKSDDDPEEDAHGVEAITTRAIDFIERHRTQPFFLYLAHNSIHSPIMAPKALVA